MQSFRRERRSRRKNATLLNIMDFRNTMPLFARCFWLVRWHNNAETLFIIALFYYDFSYSPWPEILENRNKTLIIFIVQSSCALKLFLRKIQRTTLIICTCDGAEYSMYHVISRTTKTNVNSRVNWYHAFRFICIETYGTP